MRLPPARGALGEGLRGDRAAPPGGGAAPLRPAGAGLRPPRPLAAGRDGQGGRAKEPRPGPKRWRGERGRMGPSGPSVRPVAGAGGRGTFPRPGRVVVPVRAAAPAERAGPRRKDRRAGAKLPLAGAARVCRLQGRLERPGGRRPAGSAGAAAGGGCRRRAGRRSAVVYGLWARVMQMRVKRIPQSLCVTAEMTNGGAARSGK